MSTNPVGNMDEERFNAYIQLIQQLLDCPHDEEAAILSANPELIDADLVQVMQAVAEKKPGFGVNLTSLAELQLRNPVSDQNADRLRDVAQKIENANYSLPTLQKQAEADPIQTVLLSTIRIKK